MDKSLLIILLLLAVGGLFAGGIIPFSTVGEECQNIYCNQFKYICCGLRLDAENTDVSYSTPGFFRCPTDAKKCEVKVQAASSMGFSAFYTGFTNCKITKFGIWPFASDQWECSDGIYHSTVPYELILQPGEYLYGMGGSLDGVIINYKVYSLSLVDCGNAKCLSGDNKISGDPIQGSTQCSFIPTNLYSKVYNDKGELISNSNIQQIVPTGYCYQYTTYALRTVCGDTCEYCDSDFDCANKYPNQYTYQGVTYGATCQAGQLQLYGCKKIQECIEWDETLFFGRKCAEYGTKSWCEQVNSVGVQCCPGSSMCGTNMFCDPETFTCEEEAECTYDWECSNMGTQCDWTSKELKEPVCSLGKCVWQKVKNIDCCYDTNCPAGYYCDTDYTCRQSGQGKTDCPYSCCVGESNYFDKPCISGQLCCADHICRVNCDVIDQKCDYDERCEPEIGETFENCPSDCKKGWTFDMDTMVLIMIAVMGGGTMLLIAKKSMNKKGRRRK